MALFASSVFLFQSCATIGRGTSQKIPVTSNPSGAKIIVDGEEIGHAPLNLKLKRKKSHVIQVEKPGYNPIEIRIARKISALRLAITTVGSVLAVCGCAFLGGFIGMWVGPYSTEGFSSEGARIGMIVGAI